MVSEDFPDGIVVKSPPANAGDMSDMGLIPGSGRSPGEGNGDFPSGSDGKESACNAGDPSSIPGSGRSPGAGSGNPLQYYCLENLMDREPGGLQSMGCKESDTLSK